jgi:uncharacterized protein with PIN domain
VKFVADCMLGRLAKWLKILGFDVLFFPKAEDKDLVEISRREDRILLTRDSGLIEKTKKRENRLFVASDDWEDQVVQVLDEYGLWDSVRPNTRCIECNRPLKPLTREGARNLVTPYVLEHATSFAVCPQCNRVYWQGTHYGDMERKIERILAKKPAGQKPA